MIVLNARDDFVADLTLDTKCFAILEKKTHPTNNITFKIHFSQLIYKFKNYIMMNFNLKLFCFID